MGSTIWKLTPGKSVQYAAGQDSTPIDDPGYCSPTVTGHGSSGTVTVTCSKAGYYSVPITVSASWPSTASYCGAGSVSLSFNADFVIDAPDFLLSVVPRKVSVIPGGTSKHPLTVTVTPINGFAGNVAISIQGHFGLSGSTSVDIGGNPGPDGNYPAQSTPLSVSADARLKWQIYRCLVVGTYQGRNGQNITHKVEIAVDVSYPHPINFKLASGYPTDDGQGRLTFHYTWQSSTGDLNDLDGNAGESVSYDGNNTGTYFPGSPGNYYPPDPPFGWAVENPTKITFSAKQGYLDDTHGWVRFDSPYKAASFTGVQNYIYDYTDASGQDHTMILMGPLTITRTVYAGATAGTWYYDISKSGYTATRSLAP